MVYYSCESDQQTFGLAILPGNRWKANFPSVGQASPICLRLAVIQNEPNHQSRSEPPYLPHKRLLSCVMRSELSPPNPLRDAADVRSEDLCGNALIMLRRNLGNWLRVGVIWFDNPADGTDREVKTLAIVE